MPEPSASLSIAVAHGFPHEICVDPRDGSVYSSAVDSADLPPGAPGITAITKYIPSSVSTLQLL